MIFMIDSVMVIHCKSVSNCSSEQLTRTFAVLVYLQGKVSNEHTYLSIMGCNKFIKAILVYNAILRNSATVPKCHSIFVLYSKATALII